MQLLFDPDLNIWPTISSSHLERFLPPYLQPARGQFVLMLTLLKSKLCFVFFKKKLFASAVKHLVPFRLFFLNLLPGLFVS